MSATTQKNLIKRLQTELPRGRPFDTTDMRKLGISSVLANRYFSSGWTERLARGVYSLLGIPWIANGSPVACISLLGIPWIAIPA